MPAKVDPLNQILSRIGSRTITGCIPWLGSLKSNGYGQLSGKYHKGKRFPPRHAHRIVYGLFKKIPEKNKVVMHLCDNPHCVNPSHLALGTQMENMKDSSAKGRTHTKILSTTDIENLAKGISSTLYPHRVPGFIKLSRRIKDRLIGMYAPKGYEKLLKVLFLPNFHKGDSNIDTKRINKNPFYLSRDKFQLPAHPKDKDNG